MASILTPAQHQAFNEDGFVLVPGLFDHAEITLLKEAIEIDPQVQNNLFDIVDPQGGRTKMALWNHPGDSVYGLAASCRRIVDTMEVILGGEVYHYHSKLSAKPAHTGGHWAWHQDYGYWYHNGCLFPQMASVMIAIDPSTRHNGCLKVLKGSQQMGRIDHRLEDGDQTGADPQRVEQALKTLDVVYAEMEPGDGLFFHCNTLHSSEPNRSPQRRWTLICCYNAARNNPYVEHHHPFYTPLQKVADSALKVAGVKLATGDSEAFLRQSSEPAQLQRESS